MDASQEPFEVFQQCISCKSPACRRLAQKKSWSLDRIKPSTSLVTAPNSKSAFKISGAECLQSAFSQSTSKEALPSEAVSGIGSPELSTKSMSLLHAHMTSMQSRNSAPRSVKVVGSKLSEALWIDRSIAVRIIGIVAPLAIQQVGEQLNDFIQQQLTMTVRLVNTCDCCNHV